MMFSTRWSWLFLMLFGTAAMVAPFAHGGGGEEGGEVFPFDDDDDDDSSDENEEDGNASFWEGGEDQDLPARHRVHVRSAESVTESVLFGIAAGVSIDGIDIQNIVYTDEEPSQDENVAFWMQMKQAPELGLSNTKQKLTMQGRFLLADADTEDHLDAILQSDPNQRGLMIGWIGARDGTNGGVLESFESFEGVTLLALPKAGVNLNGMRNLARELVGGNGLNVGLMVLSVDPTTGLLRTATAAFEVDSEIAEYDIEIPID